MISVAEAKALIKNTIAALPAVDLPLMDASGLVLAADTHALVDVPSFDQSSMDGYAIRFDDFIRDQPFPVSGEIPAGKPLGRALAPGSAARIFTGGALPQGADTVVMQEKVRVSEGHLQVDDSALVQGLNVRPRGAEIGVGDLALPSGTLLGPGALGFLAMVGVGAVPVYPAPRVALLVTGDELQEPGSVLSYGQVYESNSYALRAAISQWGCGALHVGHCKDNPEMIRSALVKALDQYDLILLTGGVSVGDYDFVPQILASLGVETIFHRVAQKPAKPLYFGRLASAAVAPDATSVGGAASSAAAALREKYIIGLPGNPASSLVAFYEYVVPALCALSGRQEGLRVFRAPLLSSFSKPAALTHFLKGYYDGQTTRILSAQESYRLSSFAQANCLVQVDAGITQLDEGSLVEVHMLPG